MPVLCNGIERKADEWFYGVQSYMWRFFWWVDFSGSDVRSELPHDSFFLFQNQLQFFIWFGMLAIHSCWMCGKVPQACGVYTLAIVPLLFTYMCKLVQHSVLLLPGKFTMPSDMVLNFVMFNNFMEQCNL